MIRTLPPSELCNLYKYSSVPVAVYRNRLVMADQRSVVAIGHNHLMDLVELAGYISQAEVGNLPLGVMSEAFRTPKVLQPDVVAAAYLAAERHPPEAPSPLNLKSACRLVSCDLSFPPEGRCRSENRTCLTLPAQRRCRIAAKFAACSPLHVSRHAWSAR